MLLSQTLYPQPNPQFLAHRKRSASLMGQRALSQLHPETRPAFGGTCFGPGGFMSECRVEREFTGFFFFIHIIIYILSFFYISPDIKKNKVYNIRKAYIDV
jgi:hypothetical protein